MITSRFVRYTHFVAGGTHIFTSDDDIHTSSQAELTSLLPVATRCRGLAMYNRRSAPAWFLRLLSFHGFPCLAREVNARRGANDILLGIVG